MLSGGKRREAQGLIPAFDARPIAVALNRLDASLFIHAFGRHPRQNPELVLEAVVRIWTSTLYQSIDTTTKTKHDHEARSGR
jgi:hypothetical protein